MSKFHTRILASVQVSAKKRRQTYVNSAPVFFVPVVLLTLIPFLLFGQVPTINYSSPNNFTAGTAISPLAPTGSGVAAAGYSSSPVSIGSGFSAPTGVAVDALGNVYVADQDSTAIIKIPVGGGSPVIIGSGFINPSGVAVDAAGNVYVADYGNSAVMKIPAGGSAPISIGSGFSGPHGIAVDGPGNVYVADAGNKKVFMIPVGGGSTVTLNSGLSSPVNVAVDGAGNVYVVGNGTRSVVVKIPAGGGSPVTLATSGFRNPHGIAVDVAGNVFVSDSFHLLVKEIPASGGSPITIATGFQPYGIAADASGNVYVTDMSNILVKEITPVGGYYLSKALPAGLVFSNATGIISGTATVGSPATNYTVTAYNASGHTSATLSIKVDLPPAPTLSYSSPHTYTAGTAIAPLTPASGNVAVPGYSSPPVTLGSGFTNPYSVAVDAAGNVYVADYSNNAIKEILFGGGSVIILGSGFSKPSGVAVDASGNVYVADAGNNAVKKIPVGGGSPVTLSSGFSAPNGVAVDVLGNVFVADYGNNAVKEIPVGGGATLTLGPGFNRPTGVGVDALGNVYVAELGNNTVKKIPADGSNPITLGTGYSDPIGVAVDGAGNVYVINHGNNKLNMYPAGGGALTIISGGFNGPTGIATDAAGNLFVADNNNNAVKEFKPTGGFYISPGLPAGLSFDGATGIISGTPTQASPASIYNITGYNIGNHISASVTITVNLPAIPAISYTSPHSYSVSAAITPLSPANSGGGVDVTGYSHTINSLPPFPGSVFGVTTDATGNIYAALAGNGVVMKVPAGGGAPITFASDNADPFGLATDLAGNVYVTDLFGVNKYPAGGGSGVSIGSGFNQPSGVAVDASGNVFIADQGNNAVKEVPVGGGPIITLGSGFNNPASVALDALGNVYVADQGNNAIKMIPVGGGATATLGSGFNSPSGVSVDAAGNVFVADKGNNAIKEISAGGGPVITLASSFNSPYGVATDGAGNLYVADTYNSTIEKIKPAGGYYLNQFLPAGLSFDGNTGIISGTPAVASPLTSYTITAYNITGSSSSTVYIATVNTPPTINYSSPNNYIVGSIISPLSPTATGVAAPAYSTSSVVLGTAFSAPTGVAVDAAGNVYVADVYNNAIQKIPVGGGPMITLSTAFDKPSGVAVDAAGNVYIADNNNNAVKMLPVGGGSPVTLLSGLILPFNVAIDAAGNVYVTDTYNGAIKKIPAGGGSIVTLSSDFGRPTGVAVDAQGNIYVADTQLNIVKKIPADGSPEVLVASGFNVPYSLAVDASGNLFVADAGSGTIQEVAYGSGTPFTVVSGLLNPEGVAVDGAGNIYASNTYSNKVEKFSPIGGYYINALPVGLTLNNSTGVISGKPAMISAPTNYTITAYNVAGASIPKTVNIGIIPVPVSINSLTKTASTPTNATSVQYTVTFGGVLSGLSASNFSLTTTGGVSGASVSTVTGSGKTYTITINTGTGDGTITLNLTNASGLTPGISNTLPFAGDTYIIQKSIPQLTQLYYSNSNANYLYAKVGDVITLHFGSNVPIQSSAVTIGGHTITAVYTGNPNFYTATYTMTSADAEGRVHFTLNFTDLAGNNSGNYNDVGAGDDIEFMKTPPTYIAGTGSFISNNAVSNHESKIGDLVTLTFTATKTIQTPSITIAGHIVTPTNTSGNIWTASYTMTPTDAPGIIAFSVTLVDLAGNSNTITSASVNSDLVFNTTTPKATNGDFTSNNPNDNHSAKIGDIVSLNFTTNEPIQTPTITIAGHSVIPSNITNDGITWSASYTMTSSDAAGNVHFSVYFADLAGNTISGGTPLTDVSTNSILVFYKNPPAITIGNPSATLASAGPVIYTVTYSTSAIFSKGLSPSDITVNKTGTANGSVQVTGTGPNFLVGISNLSGAGTLGFSIKAGTATDNAGNTAAAAGPSATFTLVSSNANLANLITSAGALSPVFAPTSTSYGATVDASTATVTVTATTSDINATVKVNGAAVTSGSPSGAIPLSPGANIINIVVKAQDGHTTKTYTLTVNRATSGGGGLFSYAGPKSYTVNSTIPRLSPKVTGNIAALAYNKPANIGLTGLKSPFSATSDATGNGYVADAGNNTVIKIPSGGGSPVSIGSGFNQPAAVAVDGAGNVYVADAGNSAIKEIPFGSGTPVKLPGSFIDPMGIAADAAGNVYVTDFYLNNVTRIPAGGGNPQVIASGFIHPIGITLDGAGNVYVADAGNSAIVKLTALTYAKTVISNYFYYPTGVAIDGTGNIFVADDGNNTVYEIPAGAKNPVSFAKGFKNPTGVLVDGSGSVYVTEQGNADIMEIKPAGGYFIDTMLPAGLSFSNKTGAITGTPLLSSPATIYTVTAYNATENSTGSVSIAVNGPPNFSYNSPLIYYTTWPITPLAPTVTGNQVTAGYTISPALPNGLSINGSTGVISGTPTALSAATSYTVTAVNGFGSGTATVNITVNPIVAPTVATSSLTFSNTTANSTHITWVNGNGNSRAVFIFLGSNGGPSPVNHTDYTANAAYGAGSQIGSSGWYCVYNGPGSSADITNLSAGTTYRVAAIDYNGTTGSEIYLLSGNARGNVTTMETPLNTIYLPAANSGSTPFITTISNNEKVVANNILSPNGDGVNDIWVVKNIAFYPNNRVTIYDRTGNVIFTRKNYANDWAGTYRGSVLKEGTYFYLIDLGNGKVEKGFITVVRDR